MKRCALLGLLLVIVGCGSGGGGPTTFTHQTLAVRMVSAGGRPDNHTVGSYTVLVTGGSFEHPGSDILLTSQPSALWSTGNDSIVTGTPLSVRVRVYDSLNATGPVLEEFTKTITASPVIVQNPDGSFNYEIDLQSHNPMF